VTNIRAWIVRYISDCSRAGKCVLIEICYLNKINPRLEKPETYTADYGLIPLCQQITARNVEVQCYTASQDSLVGIATGYSLDGRGSIPGRGKRFSSTPQRPYRLWGPFSLISNGYRAVFPGVKQPGREADHSPPSSAEVKNGGAILPLPHTSSWRCA
jgi:hypothetical protein